MSEFDLIEQTAEVVEILSASKPLNFSLSGDFAFVLLCQLDLAFDNSINQKIGIPPSLWEFYLELRGEIVQRCPQVSRFLKNYTVS